MRSSILRIKTKYLLVFLIYGCIIFLCCSKTAVVSSFVTVPKIARISSTLWSTNHDIDPRVYQEKCAHNAASGMIAAADFADVESEFSCRIVGFYPFPVSKFKGPMEWLFQDTHQAIIVTETISGGHAKTRRVRMDFMTKGGANHPVWYDETTKWNVAFGGSIDGEVRVRTLMTKTKDPANRFQNSEIENMDGSERNNASSKLDRLIEYASDYDCRMNLYTNNCRMFAARMEREVERLSKEDGRSQDLSRDSVIADVRCALRILWAGILPTLYPSVVILLLCKGIVIQ